MPFSQNEVIGYCVSVKVESDNHFSYKLSACDNDWEFTCNDFFDSLDTLLIVSEVFYKIKTSDWISCYPQREQIISTHPKTIFEKQYIKIAKDFNDKIENWDYTKMYSARAEMAGIKL